MKHKKTIILHVLCITLALLLLPIPALAVELEAEPVLRIETTEGAMYPGDQNSGLVENRRMDASKSVPTFSSSSSLIALIREFEGFAEKAYWDYSQYSIGYGSSLDQAVKLYPEIAKTRTITEKQAEKLLLTDIKSYEQSVNNFALKNSVTLNQNQFNALVDFTYNVGAGWTTYVGEDGKPCLLKQMLLDKPENWTAKRTQEAFGTWVHAGGVVLQGLVRRRAAEAKLFLTPVDGTPGPKDSTEPETEADPEQPENGEEPESAEEPENQEDPENPEDLENPEDPENPENPDLPEEPVAFEEPEVPEEPRVPAEPEPFQLPEAPTFYDVETGSWYYAFVEEANHLGIMNGMGGGIFAPEDSVTRAQTARALANLCGAELSNFEGFDEFNDVSPGAWYASAIGWAYQSGVVRGMGDGNFQPEANITRQHLCSMLARYLRNQGISAEGEADVFADHDSISKSSREDVYFCVQLGLVSGMGGGIFDPNGLATRAQLAKLLVGIWKLTQG